MPPRVAIAGFMHESNTFAASPTPLVDFHIHRGQELIDAYAPTFHEVGGFIAGAEAYGYELIPLLAASATPSGAVTSEAYEAIVGEIQESLLAAQADGLLLALHGAMVADDYPQADGETVRRLRAAMGPDFPIIVTHDYHGNVPPQLVEDATALIIYKTCPHIDQRERGMQAGELMVRVVNGEVNPVSAMVKPEVLFNIMFHNTSRGPMQPLMQAAIELESQPGVLAVSVAAGYQYADVPYMGPSVVVVTDGDPDLAQREVTRIGDQMWSARNDLIPEVPDAATAVRVADQGQEFPVALFELGDNVGGGSAADATVILEQLLAQQVDGWVVTLYDPEAVQQCVTAGIGATLTLDVGGKTDAIHGPILTVTGRVRTIHDGTYEETERRHGGQRYGDQGLSVVLEVNRPRPGRGGLLILTTLRVTPMSIHQVTCMGIQPHQQRILVAKGAVAPRAAYEPVCKRIIEVNTSGATAILIPKEEYHQARKSLYEWTI